MALNGLFCTDVLFRNYSLTHCTPQVFANIQQRPTVATNQPRDAFYISIYM